MPNIGVAAQSAFESGAAELALEMSAAKPAASKTCSDKMQLMLPQAVALVDFEHQNSAAASDRTWDIRPNPP